MPTLRAELLFLRNIFGDSMHNFAGKSGCNVEINFSWSFQYFARGLVGISCGTLECWLAPTSVRRSTYLSDLSVPLPLDAAPDARPLIAIDRLAGQDGLYRGA